MPRTIRFEWEGKTYEVGVERIGDRLSLTHEGKRYTVTLLSERKGPDVSPAPVTAPGTSAFQTPAPTAMKTPATAPAAEVDAAGALHAPMTGVIKEIKVGPGHNVEQGQVVLIMEAMKMDIDVPCPATGVVAEVLVKVGDTVNAQAKLMVIQ
jgi:biotin carboxyl carrier protein